MNFISLHYFLVAAEELNITLAASKLYISQQALSSHISRLEKELGVPLFNRTPKLSLTLAGRQLKQYAAEMIKLERQILQTSNDIRNNQHGEIRLGISHTCGRAILPSILPKFKATHPHIDISITEGNSSELESFLWEGKLDLVISYAPLLLDDIEMTSLIQERLFLVVPKKLLKQNFGSFYDAVKNECICELNLSLFAKMPFILLKKGNRVRSMVESALNKSGFSPNVVLETENIETAFALAQNGMGITIYPELFRWCIPGSGSPADECVDFFPMTEEDTIGTLVIARMKHHYKTQAVSDFIVLCQQVLDDIRQKQVLTHTGPLL